MNEGTNEHCMLLVLQSAVARWSAVDRIGTLTVTTFPPSAVTILWRRWRDEEQ